MRLKLTPNKLIAKVLICLAVVGFSMLSVSGTASAALDGTSQGNSQTPCLPGNSLCTPSGANNNGSVSNNGAGNTNLGEDCNKDKNNLQNCLKDNKLVIRLREIVNFLAAGVGVVTVMMIIVGGIQYTMAGDNPANVQSAKSRIYNAVIGLISFAFLWAFLQWLIPGGIFNL